MRNALHDYAKLFEKYAAANGGWGVILAGEDCLSLANEMMIDADALEAENAKLRELVRAAWKCIHSGLSCSDCRLTSGGCTLQSAMRELGVARHGD